MWAHELETAYPQRGVVNVVAPVVHPSTVRCRLTSLAGSASLDSLTEVLTQPKRMIPKREAPSRELRVVARDGLVRYPLERESPIPTDGYDGPAVRRGPDRNQLLTEHSSQGRQVLLRGGVSRHHL